MFSENSKVVGAFEAQTPVKKQEDKNSVVSCLGCGVAGIGLGGATLLALHKYSKFKSWEIWGISAVVAIGGGLLCHKAVH